MTIKCKIFSVEEIKFNEKIVEKMYLLMNEHYDNINIVKFKRDLYLKDKVFLVYNSEILLGFSTLKKMSINLNGERIEGLFSGDTIIKKGFSWGISFQKEWIKYCLEESEKNKKLNIKTYWFLISKGIKTYLYLPTYFNLYSPKLNYIESELEKNLKNIYAGELYGERYIKETGIIKNDSTNDYLKEDIENISLKKKENENIKFFISKNPNYMQGDELVCLTEISYENLTKFGKRVIKNLNI
ncbi:hypothetical protein [Fusobacterium russii]|uniref:hypothetical protein n=1 Tax=Fusobacterium russii TaxID=854 RepID=UPI0003A3180F|nr:hypothetical protein [Fusobacterium russii]